MDGKDLVVEWLQGWQEGGEGLPWFQLVPATSVTDPSQSHRVVRIGRDLKGHPGPASCTRAGPVRGVCGNVFRKGQKMSDQDRSEQRETAQGTSRSEQ